MKLVVDASVAAKWFFAEANSQEAHQLLGPRIRLHAPDFILIELTNVICKKTRLKQISSIQPYIDRLALLPNAVLLSPSNDGLLMRAAAMAAEIGHSVYDCLYLACAEEQNAPIITADAPLTRRVGSSLLDLEAWDISDPNVALKIAAAASAFTTREHIVHEDVSTYEASLG